MVSSSSGPRYWQKSTGCSSKQKKCCAHAHNHRRNFCVLLAPSPRVAHSINFWCWKTLKQHWSIHYVHFLLVIASKQFYQSLSIYLSEHQIPKNFQRYDSYEISITVATSKKERPFKAYENVRYKTQGDLCPYRKHSRPKRNFYGP